MICILAATACPAGDEKAPEDETTEGLAGTAAATEADDASTGSNAESMTGAVATSDDSGGTDVGSTGAPGVDCPQGSLDVGAVTAISLDETWTFEGRSGVSEGDCTATGYDGERLGLQCVRLDGGPEVHTLSIVGGGPVVGDALQAIVGMDGLRLFLPYGMGFFPDIYLTWHFSLRSASGELLVLRSYDWAGPGGSFAQTSVATWADPFAAFAIVDHDCARVDNPQPETAPADWKPFALEVGTDDGVVTFYEGQQQTLTVGGSTWEASVTKARMDIPCPADCATEEIAFSIVRHP